MSLRKSLVKQKEEEEALPCWRPSDRARAPLQPCGRLSIPSIHFPRRVAPSRWRYVSNLAVFMHGELIGCSVVCQPQPTTDLLSLSAVTIYQIEAREIDTGWGSIH